MSTVKWCNKEDLGFEGRIQGDVIFVEVEPRVSKMTVHKDYIDEVIYDFTVGKKFKMSIRVNLKNHPKEKFKTGDWRHDLKNLMDYMKNYFPQLHIIIGNIHELSTDGYITRISIDWWPSEGDTWSLIDLSNTFMVIGSELVICHAEHPTVKKQIPPDKALLVSIQRGSLNKRIDDRIDDDWVMW